MKTLLSVILVLGFAILAAAQAAAPSITTTQTRVEQIDGGMVLTGGVKLHFVGPGPIDVEADVAEINNKTREVVLRGNVKLTLPPRVSLP